MESFFGLLSDVVRLSSTRLILRAFLLGSLLAGVVQLHCTRVGSRARERRRRVAGLIVLIIAVLVVGSAQPVGAAGPSQVTWNQVNPPTGPAGRSGAVIAYDSATSQLVLFGGLDNNFNYLNDTWFWTGTTWSQQSPATSPSTRAGAAMAYDSATSQLVLFGGYSLSDGDLNDTWV
jgi:hypothetical protein